MRKRTSFSDVSSNRPIEINNDESSDTRLALVLSTNKSSVTNVCFIHRHDRSIGKTTQKMSSVNMDIEKLDIDSIFTKYTINEIRDIEEKLKIDMEKKKEELRSMVG